MPRPRQKITPETLPLGYENFVPLPERRFPITPPAREKRDWECKVCGFIDNLSLNNMNPKNRKGRPLAEGMGCKACKSADMILSNFQDRGLNPWLTISGCYFDHTHKLAEDQKRRFEAVVFKGRCFHGHPQTISRHALTYLCRRAAFCDDCNAEKRCLEDDRLAAPIRAHWPSADIRFVERDHLQKPHYLAEIPGSDGSPNPNAPGRIRGPISTAETGKTVSVIELRRMVKQDKLDRKRVLKFIQIGNAFGSTVEVVGLIPGTNELGVQYRNVLGELKPYYTLERAKEYCAGRPITKQAQTLVQCVLVAAFPQNEWLRDDRSYLAELQVTSETGTPISENSELDIGTRAIVDGGLWVEYQGHQSHREDPKTIESDRQKVAICRGRCLLLVIDQIKRPNAEKAIKALKNALQAHPDRERVQHAMAQMIDPDPERVTKLWLASIEGLAKKRGEQLTESMKPYGHEVLTPMLEIYSGGTFSYRCGFCRQISDNNNVKAYIDRPAKGCKLCESQRMSEQNTQKRRERWSEHSLWESLTEAAQDALCDGTDTYTCHLCNAVGYKSTLSKRNEYFCLQCLDRERRITDCAATAGTIYQHLSSIKTLIAIYDEAPTGRFEDQIAVENNAIMVSMTVNGNRHSLPLTRWQKEAAKTRSDIFHRPEEQHSVLFKAFPNYRLIESDDPATVFFQTGCGTLAPNGEIVIHPITRYPLRKLSPLHNQAGGVQRSSKNAERGQGHVDWTLIRSRLSYMHDLKNATSSSSTKTLGDIEARYKFRAACVGTDHIPPEFKREIRVTRENTTSTDAVETTDPTLHFYCSDSRHAPEVTKADSRFSTSGAKRGFCTKCLKASGINEMDFRQLETEADIVHLTELQPPNSAGIRNQSQSEEVNCYDRKTASNDEFLRQSQLKLL